MNVIYRERENGKIQAIISYKVAGEWKQKSKGGFDRKKEAKDWAKKKSFELMELERLNVVDSEMTLDDVFERYIDNLKLLGRAQGTFNGYVTASKFFKGVFDCPIGKIKEIDITEFIGKKRAETGLSYQVYLNKLITVFNFAINNLKIIYNNPCKDIKLKKIKNDNRTKFVTEELFSQIVATCPRYKIRLLCETAYDTGMRKSEVYGLNIHYIDYCLIKVRNQRVYKDVTGVLKTENSYREIPISLELYNKLITATTDEEGYIFFDVKRDAEYYHLRKFGVSMHCFRYTRTSILVSAGIDLKYISYVIGDNISTILQTYTVLNQDKLEENFEKIRNI